jgi:cystathionine gamma-synthase
MTHHQDQIYSKLCRIYPLGTTITPSPHAVSVSLPTMDDVRGYEEGDEKTLEKLKSGYPRFVVCPFAKQLSDLLAPTSSTLWITSSKKSALLIVDKIQLDTCFWTSTCGRLFGVIHPSSSESTAKEVKLYMQNVGCFISSRHAEDELVRRGVLKSRFTECCQEPNCTGEECHCDFVNDDLGLNVSGTCGGCINTKCDENYIIQELQKHAFPDAEEKDIILANCGASAVNAAILAVAKCAPKHRTRWIQLGWLYVDSSSVLSRHFGEENVSLVVDVLDLNALEEILSKNDVAGVFSEIPTNPLLYSSNLHDLANLCKKYNTVLILDASVTSPLSVDILKYADVVVSSLTKYTCSDGDMLAGVAVVNSHHNQATELNGHIRELVEPLYVRDVRRLAQQVRRGPGFLKQVSETTKIVAQWLEKHPCIRKVFWAGADGPSGTNYASIARDKGSVGGMLSFTLAFVDEGCKIVTNENEDEKWRSKLCSPMAFDKVFDSLEIAKGPSFGMRISLACPFIYLAHYNLATCIGGRVKLANCGVDPHLIRLSIGLEPAEFIINALEKAFDAGKSVFNHCQDV